MANNLELKKMISGIVSILCINHLWLAQNNICKIGNLLKLDRD